MLLKQELLAKDEEIKELKELCDGQRRALTTELKEMVSK